MACQFRTCFSSTSFRAYTAEFISTFLFVFVAVGSAVSARMLTPNVTYGATPLVATALAQGFALFATVYIAADISGGHVNPAVTFAMAICDHISVPSAITYCIVQTLASTMASFLIHFISTEDIPTTRVATAMSGFGGAAVETIITFALVYTVLVAADPRSQREKKQQTGSVVGPLAIGLVCSACILAAGSLTGASMNPARSFGPAMVSGNWGNQAVYWVGPLVGAALAGLVHHHLLYPNRVGSGLNESVVV